ncbi:MAG TPA: MFS transporter [Gemmatimonadaceae bacterium]|jgi:MFS family permease
MASPLWEDLRALPRTAWVLFGGTFINRFGSFVLAFLVFYLTSRGYSVAAAGLALSAYGIGSMAAALAGGQLADTIGRRNSIVVSMFSSAATMLALSQATGIRLIVPLTALAGFTAELYRPASYALVADLTPKGRRITGFAMYRLAVNAGVAAGPAVAGFLAERSFLWLFVGDALTSIIYGCTAYFALPKDGRRARDHADARSVATRMASDARLVRMLVATLALAFVVHQAYATFPIHLERSGFTPVIYGSLMSLNGLLIIVLELWVTTVTRRAPALIAIAAGILLNGLGFGAIGIAGSVSMLAVTVVIWTFGEMVFSPVGAAYIADIAPPDLRARYQAAWGFTFSLGLVLAPIGGTLLYSIRPSILWSTCLGVCLAAAGLIASAWLLERGTGTSGAFAASTGPKIADESAGPAD